MKNVIKQNLDFRLFLIFFMFTIVFFHFQMVSAQENSPGNSNPTGLFIEIGGFGSFPLSGGETPIGPGGPFLNPATDGLSLGGGGLLAIGYDAKIFAVGGKFKQSFYPGEDWVYSGNDFVTHLLLHTKIFPFDISNVDLGPFRPYVLFDLGAGLALISRSSGIGFDLNTGLGVQWLITEHAYMAFETTYAGLFAGDLSPNDSFDASANGNIHAIDVGLNLGVKF